MTPTERPGRVLLIEDSEGGAQLMRIAFRERLPAETLEIYGDGERALAALDAGDLAEWDLVLLDLRLPVVVLSHSEVVQDVARSYDLGANSHIAKPHTLDALFEVVETLGRYWLKIVSLPS